MKALVDTSFLLPSMGIDVGRKAVAALEKLQEDKAEIYFSQFSILESLWVAARLCKTEGQELESVLAGLRSILEGGVYKRATENWEVFTDALRLYLEGHRDIIDNILYADSIHYEMKLLTLDTELKGFIQARKLQNTIITPDDVV